ncbi:hypothetical protein LWX53_08285 [bacterium]|nr:hypothetical protein [bacterium]
MARNFMLNDGTAKQARAPAFILSTVLFAAIFSSCGLPTIAYLYSPKDMTVNNGIVSLKNNSYNYDASDGTFLGYEIYYRIFQSPDDAGKMLGEKGMLNLLASQYDKAPDSFIAAATGSGYKFIRLRNSYNNTEPLIPVSDGSDASYYLTLNSNADWSLTNSNDEPLFGTASETAIAKNAVIRNITATATSQTSFYKKYFQTGEADYTGSTANTSDKYYIVFFSVAYGTDQNTIGQPVYSMPFVPSSYAEY